MSGFWSMLSLLEWGNFKLSWLPCLVSMYRVAFNSLVGGWRTEAIQTMSFSGP